MAERLQKILAKAGIASRRAAEELIRQGVVTVDGRVVTELGTRVDPLCQAITCHGKTVSLSDEKIYLLLNKPAGYITTAHDPQGRPVVTSLVKNLTALRVFPVGRLDFDTEGALLLTNDGELAQQVQHPSFEVHKTYEAVVSGRPSRQAILRLEQGIELEGRRTWPAAIRMLAAGTRESRLEITIHEGRKRQVRKMFDAVGHPVLRLKRTAYGGLRLGNLPTGKARVLHPKELRQIFSKKKSLYNSKGSG